MSRICKRPRRSAGTGTGQFAGYYNDEAATAVELLGRLLGVVDAPENTRDAASIDAERTAAFQGAYRPAMERVFRQGKGGVAGQYDPDRKQDIALQIADGYHRVCASYHLDENADIPCRIVDLTSP